MPDYKTMYFELFSSITDAIEVLSKAQRKAEEIYINSFEEEEKIKRPEKGMITAINSPYTGEPF